MTDVYPIPDFLRKQPAQIVTQVERPILFSAPMILALLAGTKTQTRRAVKDQPITPFRRMVGHVAQFWERCAVTGMSQERECPYGQPGDRIYVRENAWQRPERTPKMMREGADTWPPFIYDADYPAGIPWVERDNLKTWGWKRRPSIHLPRKGSRILLEIAAVRVERLQDIGDADALAEGIQPADPVDFGTDHQLVTPACRRAYARLWESINGPGSWGANPWVWVVEFRRVKA